MRETPVSRAGVDAKKPDSRAGANGRAQTSGALMQSTTEGKRVIVKEWGEDPMTALDEHTTLESMTMPNPIGANDVVLRIRRCAVGWVDLIMASGQYQHMAPPPYTPGLEFAGEVAAVGEAVTRVKVGDRVLADGFYTGPRSAGAYQRYGGFATWALIPEHAAIPLPDVLSFEQAVNLLGNYETAYHVLVTRAKLQPEETVVINGASGSTGLAALRIAKLIGARTIATGRSDEKLQELLQRGADHVLHTPDAGALRDLPARVKALTGGAGAHVIYDGVGGPLLEPSLRALRFGGRFCIVGWAATPDVARGKGGRGAPNANLVPTNIVQMKGLDVLGCPAVISLKYHPEWREERQEWIFEQIAKGRFVPDVGHAYPITSYREAMKAKWQSRHVGGCHLVID